MPVEWLCAIKSMLSRVRLHLSVAWIYNRHHPKSRNRRRLATDVPICQIPCALSTRSILVWIECYRDEDDPDYKVLNLSKSRWNLINFAHDDNGVQTKPNFNVVQTRILVSLHPAVYLLSLCCPSYDNHSSRIIQSKLLMCSVLLLKSSLLKQNFTHIPSRRSAALS